MGQGAQCPLSREARNLDISAKSLHFPMLATTAGDIFSKSHMIQLKPSQPFTSSDPQVIVAPGASLPAPVGRSGDTLGGSSGPKGAPHFQRGGQAALVRVTPWGGGRAREQGVTARRSSAPRQGGCDPDPGGQHGPERLAGCERPEVPRGSAGMTVRASPPGGGGV